MSSSNDQIVPVTSLRRSNDVAGFSIFDERLDADVRDNFVAFGDARNESLAIKTGDIRNGNVWSFGSTRCAEGSRDGFIAGVDTNTWTKT